MDWMDQNLPDDLAIAVVNETGSRTTANVGCRAGGDVLFVDRVTLEPGGRREWSESVAGPVEIGVQVRGGPEATERFDPTDGSGRVSAAIAAASISFSTAGGRGATGGAGTAGTGGGVDSFAAAETSGGDFGGGNGGDGGAFGDDRDDGWGFGDDGTDAGDSWGFDDATTGERAGGADGSVSGSGDADGADTSTSTPRSGAGSGAAADSSWGFGDDGDDPDDGPDTGGDTAEPGATADADGGPAGTTEAGTGTDADSGGSRRGSDAAGDAGADDAGNPRTGSRASEPDERRTDAESHGEGRERGSGDRGDDSGESSGSADATADSGGAEPARNDRETRTTEATAAGASGRGDDTDGGSSPTAGAGEMYCSSCGSVIKEQAELCPECGVRQSDTSASTSGSKDKTSAALLAIFLGFIGAHHFYLGNTGRGILYLLLSWTLIPGTIALIEAVIYLTKSEEEFQRKYG